MRFCESVLLLFFPQNLPVLRALTTAWRHNAQSLPLFPVPNLPLCCPLAVDWGDHLRHPGLHNRGTKRVVDGLPPEALGGLGHPLLAAAGEDPGVSTGGPQSSLVNCRTVGDTAC
jgi:hypothetical protein